MIKKFVKTTKDVSKFVFIDTCVFLDVLYSDSSSEIMGKIISELNSNKVTLILPKVILKEIEKDFKFWKKDLLSGIEKNLSIDLILGITDKEKTGGKDSKKQKKTDNSLLIEKITKEDRLKLTKTVESFYNELETKLEFIFQHKNTKVIELDNNIILKGIERSLLKRAPSTKLDKKIEHQHMKDVDCIAFESLLSFFDSVSISKSDIFYLITGDSDYKMEDSDLLRDELINDLSKFKKTNIKYFQSIDHIFVGKSKKEINKTEKEILGSLFGADEGLVESSEKHLNTLI